MSTGVWCVHTWAWICICICASALQLPQRESRWCCWQVNPAPRLSIKLSDQTINNSDCGLSRSITDHRLRGRLRHGNRRQGDLQLYTICAHTKKISNYLHNCLQKHCPEPQIGIWNHEQPGDTKMHRCMETQEDVPLLHFMKTTSVKVF